MKRDSKKGSHSHINKTGEHVSHFVYYFVLTITAIIFGWGILLYINEGIRLPVWVLFGILLAGICIVVLCYKHRYQRITIFLKKKFPKVTLEHTLKIIFIFAIIFGVVARFGIAFIGKTYAPVEPLSDTGIHWQVAGNLSRGEQMSGDTAIYEAFFPHLMAYSVTLSAFIRIFGQNALAVVISNLLFDAISIACLYFFLRGWKNKRVAMIGAIIWLINPISILYCGVGMSMIVTNTFIMIAILLAYYTYQAYHEKKIRLLYFLSCLFGLTIAIGNSFRPIFTVMLIAVGIVSILHIFSSSNLTYKKVVPAAISFIIMLSGCFIGTKLIDFSYQHLNPYHVSGGTGVGWNFMLGANYESQGRWNRTDSAWFGQLVYGETLEPDLVGIQQTFFKEGIKRYGSLKPFQLVLHFLHKTQVLFIDQDSTLTWPFTEAYNISSDNTVYKLIHGLGVALFAVLFCLAGIYITISLKSKAHHDQVLLFLCLCFCGLIAASLLVEVMWRYVLQAMVIVLIIAACMVGKTLDRKSKNYEEC